MHNSKPDAYDSQAYGPVPGAGPMVQGKVAILAIVFLGVAASIGSCVYYARLQQRPLALWGSEPARLMLRAPQALAYKLEPAEGEAAAGAGMIVDVAGERLRLVGKRDVTQAPGFSHIRQSFVHNASFDWEAAPGDCQPRWTHALRFVDGEQSATMLFAFNCGRAALVSGEPAVADLARRSASIRPVSAAIEKFLVELDPKAPAVQPKDAGQ